ncbi:MAG: inorganic phosphate transporter [Planctomycetes bacterium]|nr:inorganic phosphate transporter [Planctomycetota bacterium]
MSAGIVLLLAAGALMALANGANDISKGIATLVGSGGASYPWAIRWGAFSTALGGLAGAGLSGAMLATFGEGLLEPGTAPSLSAALATILGAAAWVLFATRTGLPVSTTHAILGAIAGAGLAAYGPHAVRWGPMGARIALPLLLSPLVSLALTIGLSRAWRVVAGRSSGATDCLCATVEPAREIVAAGGMAAVVSVRTQERLRVTAGPSGACSDGGRVAIRLTLDHLHWVTSGLASFARGLNDAPKMVALVLAAGALSAAGAPSGPLVFIAVTAGMVGGGLFAGRRVTRVLAEKITPMDHREGFTANLVTSALVTAGALGGLPMSTTHVSSAAIAGLGLERGGKSIRWETVRQMALAWLVTLPAAALLGALGVWILP